MPLSPTVDGKRLYVSGRPSGRLSIVRSPVGCPLTPMSISRDTTISVVLSGSILMKLVTNIHPVRGYCWKGFQMTQIKVILIIVCESDISVIARGRHQLCTNVWMLERRRHTSRLCGVEAHLSLQPWLRHWQQKCVIFYWTCSWPRFRTCRPCLRPCRMFDYIFPCALEYRIDATVSSFSGRFSQVAIYYQNVKTNSTCHANVDDPICVH